MPHKIMVPFKFTGKYTLKSIADEGEYKVTDTIAVVTDEKNNELKISMVQKWPVKTAIKAYREKPRPFKLLETGVRTIDTLNPIVEGGTGFIPAHLAAANCTATCHFKSRRKRIIVYC